MRDLPLLYSEKYDCCGCGACRSICPKNAISMELDNEGFMYPHINRDLCVRCYKCQRVCPIKSADEKRD